MTLKFVCCPECGSPFHLKRLGPVGKRGVKDSRRVLCTICNHSFRTKGGVLFNEGEGVVI